MRALMTCLLLLATAPAWAVETIAYGDSGRQRVDVYPVPAGPAPLLLFIHGGGWSTGGRDMGEGAAPVHFNARGFAWASAGYRLVPGVRVEDQLGDLALALRQITRRAGALGIDPQRIILIGHSSGAHLAALLATDPRWIAQAGLRFDAIRGVVALDGAGLDLQSLMQAVAGQAPFYDRAFGADRARWRALDPVAYAAAPNAPFWFMAYDRAHNGVAGQFAGVLGRKLEAAGAKVELVPIEDTTHMAMLRDLGRPGDPMTARVDAFLDAVLDQSGRGPALPRM